MNNLTEYCKKKKLIIYLYHEILVIPLFLEYKKLIFLEQDNSKTLQQNKILGQKSQSGEEESLQQDKIINPSGEELIKYN